jgi:hypothetical protein
MVEIGTKLLLDTLYRQDLLFLKKGYITFNLRELKYNSLKLKVSDHKINCKCRTTLDTDDVRKYCEKGSYTC